jgi:predicted nuclease of predicted toxin-antitoxin system
MEFAAAGGYVVITYDLDFGALLAATNASAPSVVLIRATDVTAPTVEALVIAALGACAEELRLGAIVTIEEAGHRVRALPFLR